RQDVAERATVEILHHEVCDLTCCDSRKTKVGNVDHVRMAQPAGSARLALEAFDKLIVTHELRRNELQRDITLGAQVSCEIDCAHPALSQQVFQAVFVVKNFAYVLFESRHESPMLSHLSASEKH